MKKVFLAIVMSAVACVAAFAQEAEVTAISEIAQEEAVVSPTTEITFMVPEGKSVKLYYKEITKVGTFDFLCETPDTVTVPTGQLMFLLNKPFGSNGILLETTGTPLNIEIDMGNSGLSTLGTVMTIIGSSGTGAGVGLALVGLMENDTGFALKALLGVSVPSIAVAIVGNIIHGKNAPKFIQH